jgi:hypothetical protein
MDPNIVFCSYADMGKVLHNACIFLNTSPSFLQQNKQKSIKLSTLKGKLNDWQRDVRAHRDAYAMGQEAFYDLATHPDSTKLIIQLVRMQEVALQRQEREKAQVDPARNDNFLAPAVRIPSNAVPVAGQSQDASPVPRTLHPDTVEGRFLMSQEHYARERAVAGQSSASSRRSNSSRGGGAGTMAIDRNGVNAVLAHAANSQATHPAAVAPNTIHVWSGSSGSSNKRKRLIAVAGGEDVPTAQRPSIDGFLPDFKESANAYRFAQETKSNAAMLGAATAFIEYARTLPADDPMRQDLLNLGVQKTRDLLKLNVTDAPVVSVKPSVPPPVLPEQPSGQSAVQPSASFDPLECSICFATFDINPARGTYTNCIFTFCQHAFHPACLAEHRRTQISRAGWRPVMCPNCNAELPSEGF